jgi:decaprenylphospho-beta-D-ribofuranose 2-oxidase
MTRRPLTGWGRTAPTVAALTSPISESEAVEAVSAGSPGGVVARGLGRSYGDPAQNAGGRVIDTLGLDRFDLDRAEGTVTAAGGVSLDRLMRALLPRGWFVPVTPGTRFVTVGGAIASDIHGKNHHRSGTFGASTTRLRVALPDGSVETLTPESTPDRFWATTGGMGLTGLVLDATFRITPVETSLLAVDTDRAPDLDACMALLAAADSTSPYSVAWIDCLATGAHLGRSVVTSGRFATRAEADAGGRAGEEFAPRDPVPAPPVPNGLLNRLSIAAFNELWYRKAPARRRDELQTISQFFHPLDMLGGWNRLYGPAGFLQHQCVLPDGEEATLRAIVELLATSGAASFLAVLKRFGAANPGHLSFPTAGWTLALDLPARGGGLAALLDEVDDLVLGAGGRIYLAKDSRARPEVVHAMYPRLAEWRAIRDQMDPERRLQSDMARRLRLLG